MDEKLLGFMKKLRWWLFGKNLVHLLFWCLPAGVFVAAACETASYFVPWYHVHYCAAAVVAASAVLAVVVAFVRFPRMEDAARTFDATGMKERTMTAVELIGSDHVFADVQKRDAWEHIRRESVTARLPINLSWKRPVLLAVLCAVFLASCLVPSPARTQAKNVHEIGKSAKELVKKVEKAEEEIKKDGDLPEEEQQKLADTVAEIRKELNDAKSKQSLDKAKERAATKLNQIAEKTKDKKKRRRLEKLADSMMKQDVADDGSSGKDDSGGEDSQEKTDAAAGLEQQLDELEQDLDEDGSLDGLSGEELEELAENLEEISEMGKNKLSEEEIKDLQSISEKVSSGNISKADIKNAKAALAKAGGGAGASNKNENGSGGAPGSSGGNSSNGNSPNGAGGSGNGSPGKGNGGQGGGAGGGTGWNRGSNVGKEQEGSYDGEMVAIPGGQGDDENLTGAQNEGTNYKVEGGQSPTWAGENVQYEKVLGEYSRKARSDIENSNYPSGVQNIVKSYFEGL